MYDTVQNDLRIVKTKGINIAPRKNHMAAVYGMSMIVYGGQFENN